MRPKDAQTPRWPNATPTQTAALYRAVMLAPSLEVCEALLRGERLPIGRLDPEWVRRLGVK